MDPNETLRLLREAMKAAGETAVNSGGHLGEQVLDACGLWDSLDGWVSRGGFLPSAWRHGQDGPACDLLARVRAVEEHDGSWPGGDVVQVLTEWFKDQGIPVD